MPGLSFQLQKPTSTGSPNRMDIACFVGLVSVQQNASRDDINQWLYEQSWLTASRQYKPPYDKHQTASYHRADAAQLLDVPIPIENWEQFAQLFDWKQRLYGEGLSGAAYLATAVHSFFAQGGRKCYVVRVAEPLPYTATATQRNALLQKLIPGFPDAVNSTPADRSKWHGIGHVLGLPEVTMLCLPDLPDLMQTDVAKTQTETDHFSTETVTEQFVKCSDGVTAALPEQNMENILSPACDLAGYKKWGQAILRIKDFISEFRKDIQLVAAMPLPHLVAEESQEIQQFMQQLSWQDEVSKVEKSLSSAFVQLCYPWLNTVAGKLLPQGLEPPDGCLCGLLAGNALTRGAFRSVTGLKQSGIQGLFPALRQENIFAKNIATKLPLIDRVSLFGNTLDGIGLLSDVTSSDSSNYRQANINRTISMVVRIAGQVGEEFIFENNGEHLWAEINQRLNDVLRMLFELGALRGKSAEEAFFVRCDRSTMRQQDMDAGRIIAQVHFEPAASIESIDVLLAMHQNGSVMLASIGLEQAAA